MADSATSRRRATRYWRLVVLSVALVAELVALVGLTRWQGIHQRQLLDELYEAPSPLPLAAAGVPIRVWKLPTDGIDGNVYGMLYHSRSVDGRDIAVSGYIAVPDGLAPVGGRPLVSLSHGTVGGADRCAPSRAPGDDKANVNPLLAKGWIVASTDFEGIGGTGPHPYLVGLSEARSMIDAVRAARRLVGPAAGSRYMAWGLSQGGHAALFVRQVSATWAPELKLVGAVALAPVSNVAGFVSDPTIAPQAITLLAVSGYSAAYPALHPDQLLNHEGQLALTGVEKDCLGDLNSPLAGVPLPDLRPVNPIELPAWRHALEENAPALEPSLVPVLVVQGTRDPIVPFGESRHLVDRLCRQQADVRFAAIAGATHTSIVESGRSTYIDWMLDRFAGVRPSSNCRTTS